MPKDFLEPKPGSDVEVNKANEEGIIFNGKQLDMDRSNPWKVAKMLVPFIAKELKLPVEDVVSDGPHSEGSFCSYNAMILRNDGSKENKKHGSHIGYMNPKTGELRITDPHDGRLILIRTGMEDMRPESERVSDFFGGINEKTLFEKSRIGFQPGQNYIDGQVFSPIKLIFALTRKSNNPTVETLSPEKINHAIYESFLGAVGQLEGPQGRGFPYEGHTMAPKEVIDAIQNAKSPYEVAEIIRKNWKQIFSEIEAYIAYEKRNTGFGLGEESLT